MLIVPLSTSGTVPTCSQFECNSSHLLVEPLWTSGIGFDSTKLPANCFDPIPPYSLLLVFFGKCPPVHSRRNCWPSPRWPCTPLHCCKEAWHSSSRFGMSGVSLEWGEQGDHSGTCKEELYCPRGQARALDCRSQFCNCWCLSHMTVPSFETSLALESLRTGPPLFPMNKLSFPYLYTLLLISIESIHDYLMSREYNIEYRKLL